MKVKIEEQNERNNIFDNCINYVVLYLFLIIIDLILFFHVVPNRNNNVEVGKVYYLDEDNVCNNNFLYIIFICKLGGLREVHIININEVVLLRVDDDVSNKVVV